MNINYKIAAEKDIDLILIMMNEFYLFDKLPYDAEVITSGLKKLFSSDAYGRFWIICEEANPIGYIIVTHGFSLEYHGVDALIDEFYIREPYRGKGIGRQTLVFIQEELRKTGIKAFHLEVDHFNSYAKEVYRKFGFADHSRYLMTKWIEK